MAEQNPIEGMGDTLEVPLREVTLVELVESQRFYDLDKHESYLHAAQDAAKMYDWDGNLVTDDASPIEPGWVVPMAHRKPCARYDLSRVIVSRYTALLFGEGRFPELTVPGDPDQEDYVKGLVEAVRLPLRMIEARNVGGSQGSVGVSFAFAAGKPKIEVHKAKHVTILGWRDRSELRPSAVIKAYKYPRRVFDPESGKMRDVDFFYARLWTETTETVWEPIPVKLAQTEAWSLAPSTTVVHGFGFCPFYWTQNLPEAEDDDGHSDYHGLLPNLDEMNRLMSASVRAVKANSDPTFVVKEDPALKEDHIRKGQGAAIFSRGGAEYVVLPPHTVESLNATKEQLRQATLDVASVITADPEKLSGAAQSAQALRILYAPMLAQCDIYREQYGELLLKPIVLGMLRAAAVLESRGEAIVLPPRVVVKEGSKEAKLLERRRGKSEQLVLNWNPYFSPTWPDIKSAVEAVKAANGEKAILSVRSSLAAVQTLLGVENVDEELARIYDDSERAIQTAQAAMMGGPQPGGIEGKGPKPEGDEEPELEDDDEEDDETDSEEADAE